MKGRLIWCKIERMIWTMVIGVLGICFSIAGHGIPQIHIAVHGDITGMA